MTSCKYMKLNQMKKLMKMKKTWSLYMTHCKQRDLETTRTDQNH